jgi:hypothetical protein
MRSDGDKAEFKNHAFVSLKVGLVLLILILLPAEGLTADKRVGIHSAPAISQSLPWIAREEKILEASLKSEVKALEPRLEMRYEAIQTILDEVAAGDPRAKNLNAQQLVDRRYLEEMDKSGFFEKLWSSRE